LHQKRTALALAAAVCPVVLLAAPAAQAAVVDVDYRCETPIGPKGAVSPIDIKAVQSGGAYKITMSFRKGVSSSPVELGKGAMKPSAVIELGGAETGQIRVSGPPNAAAVPAGTPIRISDLSGTYKPAKSGKVTFTAGVLTIKALGTTTTCTPPADVPVSLELDTSAQPGGAAGGTSTGGGTSTSGGTSGGAGGSSGGGLAETGAADTGALRALALVAGTVILLGGAVFTFTPWQRLRGTR
jgi:hypothetical protein